MTTYIHYSTLISEGAAPGSADPVVWVPGEQVACQQVAVPPVAARKWQAMIPWLMEDRLLHRPDDTEFSWGDKSADSSVPVLAVSRAALTEWRQTLAAKGQGYKALVPDFFALPWRQGVISMAVIGERCLVRSGRWQGAAGPCAFILPLVENLVARDQAALDVYCVGAQPVFAEPLASVASFIQTPDLFARAPGEWFPLAGAEQREHRVGWPLPARVAAVLAVALLALLAAASLVETRYMNAQAEGLETQLRGAYRNYFGESYDFAMADFQRVVSSRLAGPEEGSGAASALVAEFAAAVAACPGCRLDRLQLTEQTLTALVSGAELAAPLEQVVASHPGLSYSAADSGWRLMLSRETHYQGDSQ